MATPLRRTTRARAACCAWIYSTARRSRQPKSLWKIIRRAIILSRYYAPIKTMPLFPTMMNRKSSPRSCQPDFMSSAARLNSTCIRRRPNAPTRFSATRKSRRVLGAAISAPPSPALQGVLADHSLVPALRTPAMPSAFIAIAPARCPRALSFLPNRSLDSLRSTVPGAPCRNSFGAGPATRRPVNTPSKSAPGGDGNFAAGARSRKGSKFFSPGVPTACHFLAAGTVIPAALSSKRIARRRRSRAAWDFPLIRHARSSAPNLVRAKPWDFGSRLFASCSKKSVILLAAHDSGAALSHRRAGAKNAGDA